MQTITAVIPAKNEEKNIERCLQSLQWCNKILVMWMGDDQTEKIAEKMHAEVIKMNKSKADDFIAVQKNINWAIDHCQTDWILRVDADEVVTTELKDEIFSILKSQIQNPKYQIDSKFNIKNYPVAYGIPRKQYFLGDFLRGGDWAYDRLVRLFRPEFTRYETLVSVHEQLKVNGKVGYLKNSLLHYSHPKLKDAIKKFQLYTDIEINDLRLSKIQTYLNLFFRPPYVFLRWMIWHHGYRDGIRGLVAGSFRGWYEFLLYEKYLYKLKKNANKTFNH